MVGALGPILVAAGLLASACEPSDGFSARRGSGGSEDTSDDDTPVVVAEDAFGDWPDCDQEQGCWEDYLALTENLPEACLAPASFEDVLHDLDAIVAGEMDLEPEPLEPEEFEEELTEALGASCLFDGLNPRRLLVETLALDKQDGIQRHDLLFEDPYVGRFTGILLLPAGDGPHAAVVAIHGHGDTAEDYLYEYNGWRFPEHGLALLALHMRADQYDDIETEVAWDLLMQGSTFMGMRSYETRLAAKYLRWNDKIDGERLGLIGHSGGSVASNISIHVEDAFSAYVSDLTSDYINQGKGNPRCTGDAASWECILDETSPNLWVQHWRINDFDRNPAAVLEVPYGYVAEEEGIELILDFFESWIG